MRVPGVSDCGAAPLDSPLVLELLEVLVVDLPQSHESDFELSLLLLSSVLSHPDSELPDDVEEELELDELDELDDELELLELLDELELEELDDELEVSLLLLPQLSPLVSADPPVSLPAVDVLPQPSSATVLSSPVSS